MWVSINVFILGVTSVMLIVFGFLAAVSGLCLAKPEVVERATFGIFTYGTCVKLHLGTAMAITVTTAVIHGVAGLYLWLLRMGRNWLWLWVAGLAFVAWFLYYFYE